MRTRLPRAALPDHTEPFLPPCVGLWGRCCCMPEPHKKCENGLLLPLVLIRLLYAAPPVVRRSVCRRLRGRRADFPPAHCHSQPLCKAACCFAYCAILRGASTVRSTGGGRAWAQRRRCNGGRGRGGAAQGRGAGLAWRSLAWGVGMACRGGCSSRKRAGNVMLGEPGHVMTEPRQGGAHARRARRRTPATPAAGARRQGPAGWLRRHR